MKEIKGNLPKTPGFAPIDFRTRFPALDGVRALAICLVFSDHYLGGMHGNLIMRFFGHLRHVGWAGVDLFFVLSGFLITGILHDTRNDSKFFSRFYARRSLRIFPLFYGLALLLLLLTPVLHLAWRPKQFWFLAYFGNIFANMDFSLYTVPSRWPAGTVNLGHLWSLCVEEQFYLIWPLIVWMARDRLRTLWVALGLIGAEFAARIWIVTHVRPEHVEMYIFRNLAFRMDTLLMGAVLALLLRGPQAVRWQGACKWVFVGGAAIFFPMLIRHPGTSDPWLMSWGLTVLAITSAGLVGAVLLPTSPWQRMFSIAPARILGRYSYGFYIYHVLFIKFWYVMLGVVYARVHSVILTAAILIPANFLLTFLISKISYDFFELPILRKKTRFEYDLETKDHVHAFELQA